LFSVTNFSVIIFKGLIQKLDRTESHVGEIEEQASGQGWDHPPLANFSGEILANRQHLAELLENSQTQIDENMQNLREREQDLLKSLLELRCLLGSYSKSAMAFIMVIVVTN
jgi:hypothetical protein